VIALAYLATVAVGLVVLAVALRRRPAPAGAAPAPTLLPTTAATEIRTILAAAAQLAARLDTAA
jgi:hypothetical protein